MCTPHSPAGEGGGGSIFWKTQDTALYSTYIESSLDLSNSIYRPGEAQAPVVKIRPGAAQASVLYTSPDVAQAPVVKIHPGAAQASVVYTSPDVAQAPVVKIRPDTAQAPVF